jgi:hypothetical protein
LLMLSYIMYTASLCFMNVKMWERGMCGFENEQSSRWTCAWMTLMWESWESCYDLFSFHWTQFWKWTFDNKQKLSRMRPWTNLRKKQKFKWLNEILFLPVTNQFSVVINHLECRNTCINIWSEILWKTSSK